MVDTQILDCKPIREKISTDLRSTVKKYRHRGIVPKLGIVMVGNNEASNIYMRSKKRLCAELGIDFIEYILPESTTTEKLDSLLAELNKDYTLHGILIEQPLPKHINKLELLNPPVSFKDIDSFNLSNHTPCTTLAILEIIKHYNIQVRGKHCVIVGRSGIVGKPTALALLDLNATVTICHSFTENLGHICKSADIVIAAVGKERFIGAEHIKESCIVIDAGINRDAAGVVVGDVDTQAILGIASKVTPVPNGVGSLTVMCLIQNLLNSVLSMG